MSFWTARRARHIPLLVVLAGYAATRVFYGAIGLTFDVGTIDWFWQYQDVEELRHNLWEAVFYQHTQPPLYNLFLGLGLKLPSAERFFRVSYVAFGLGLHVGIFALARRVGVRPWLACATALIFALSPASILMETWLFYEYPVAALIVLSGVALYRAQRSERGWDLALAFGLMALVVLTRSLFHLLWIASVVAIAALSGRHRLRILACALAPLALAGSIYAKNWVVFGRPVASTWLGFSLSRLTTTKLSGPERAELARDHALSPLGGTLPWLPLQYYPAAYRALPPGVPPVRVLTEPRRASGHLNFNHAAYIGIAATFERDARVVMERYPEVWLRSVKQAWQLHFLPIHDYTFFHERRRAAGPAMRNIERAYELAAGSIAFVGWSWDRPMPPFDERPGWAWAIVTAAALLIAIALALRRGERARRVLLFYCVLTIAWVALVGNSLELGENHRFRFLSEPLTYCLVALMVERALRRLRRRTQ